MRKTSLFLLLCLVALAAGCPKTTPVRPEVVTKIANYQIAQLDIDTAKYECAVNGETFIEKELSYKTCGTNAQNSGKARQLRDEVIYRLIRITDYNYFQFENDLYVKRASGSVLADIIDTGANLAATISNGERAKTIINASIIAFRGGRKSVSIHYFQEQTADALISSMQTSRNRVLAEMITQMRDKDVDAYSLDAALGDVIRYFFAGTLPRALQELKQNANKNAQIAKDKVLELKGINLDADATVEKEVVSTPIFVQIKGLVNELIAAKKLQVESTKKQGTEAETVLRNKLEVIWRGVDAVAEFKPTIEKVKGNFTDIFKKIPDKYSEITAEQFLQILGAFSSENSNGDIKLRKKFADVLKTTNK